MFFKTNPRSCGVDEAVALRATRSNRSLVVATALVSTLLSACVSAAVPVEESASRGGAGAPAAANVSTARLSELYYQLQTLQQEVQDLRGLVEEQAHQLKRLRKDQKSQYLDLDRRMQGVSSSGGQRGAQDRTSTAPARAPAAPAGGNEQPQLRDGELYVPVAGAGSATGGGNPAPAANSGAADSNERKAYGEAIGLMKARQFDESILSFNRLVVDYPGGSYNGHAFYWLGELYLAKGQDAKARQQFVQVIDLYPDHAKVPDALYKIGVVYHRQGDKHRALEYLNRVRAEHAGSNAAGLAADYAKEMQ